MTKSIEQWREAADTKFQHAQKVGPQLQEFAERVGLPEGFVISLDWEDSIRWSDWGFNHDNSLQVFRDRVRRTAEKLGPPCSVTTGGNSNREGAPDLYAHWTITLDPTHPDHLKKVEIWVNIFHPKGCKVDPRTPYVPAQEAKIHPECAEVLRQLEDAGT